MRLFRRPRITMQRCGFCRQWVSRFTTITPYRKASKHYCQAPACQAAALKYATGGAS